MKSVVIYNNPGDPNDVRNQFRAFLWQLVKKKWFWVIVIVLVLLAVILDIGLAITWVGHTLIFTPWNPTLLWLGVITAFLGAVTSNRKVFENKAFKDLSKILFFIVIILSINDYGFKQGMVFIFAVLFLGKIIGWITPKKNVLKRVS